MRQISLTEAEWEVMECLWAHSPQTGRETVRAMEEKKNWTRSTTLTLLRRLEEKGAVGTDSTGAVKAFYPLIERETVAAQQTESLLKRAYQGSLSLMVSSLTKRQKLTEKEVQELYSILDGLEDK